MASSLQMVHHQISRKDIHAVMVKVLELRAIHAAVAQGSSPANLRLPGSPSPSLARPSNHFTAQDYPVFTPSYDEELPVVALYHRAVNRRFWGVWEGSEVEKEQGSEVDGSDCRRSSLSVRKEPVSGEDDHGGVSSAVFEAQDGRLRDNPCFNHLSPGDEVIGSEIQPVTTCNACRPATINRERGEGSEGTGTKIQENQLAALAPKLQQKTSSGGGGKGPIFSWLFPRGTKKKQPKAACGEPAVFGCLGWEWRGEGTRVRSRWVGLSEELALGQEKASDG